jgi:MSHA biogenesis protein MshI
VLQIFKRKGKVSGQTGLLLGERHFELANLVRNRGELFLSQCARVEVQGQQQLREKLSEQVEQMGLQGSSCNAVLASRDYNLYLVEAPAVEQEELRAAVRWKIKDLLDIPVEEAVIDLFPVPEDAFQGRSKMLYVVAAARSRVQQVVELCQRAKLELASIDVPEMIMRNISSQFADDQNGLAFLSLKTNGSSMNITRQGNLYLARKINTQMSPDVMSAGDWESQRDRLVLELQRSLDYYESQMAQNPVAHVVMAPRLHDTEALVSSLNEVMGIKVSALTFASQLEAAEGISGDAKHACMLAIGAALRYDTLTARG